MTNHLRTALRAGDFLCSAELVLGRDHAAAEAESFVRDAAREPGGVRIISLTDLPGGNPALPPEALCSFVLDQGLTPIAHLTGKDGNRSLIESRLHGFARMGVRNVLALTGDAQKAGFRGKSKPVYDLDSALILLLVREMEAGIAFRLGAREVRTTPFDFFAGAVVNPYKVREPDLMMQLYKLELKIALGARFVITQLGFDLRKLYELKQYMTREGLDHVPLIANVYVPTATIAGMMKTGELAGCVVHDSLIERLKGEKKPQRLERASLYVAAARDLGFAGVHVGGFGLSHGDFMTIMERAAALGTGWRSRVEELILAGPNDFYLLPRGSDGLSDAKGHYLFAGDKRRSAVGPSLARVFHRYLVQPDSVGARLLAPRLRAGSDSWRKGFWYRALGLSSLYRKAMLGCAGCGDCVQDHLQYSGCTMRWCYKELRNGPCGGSRVDGSCEADPELPCIWNLVYGNIRAAGEDPRKLARTLIPPRDWILDETNALANRLAGLDNYGKRVNIESGAAPCEKS